MKKRILALALAGTTAFSVFGAAMSASAAPSTDTAYDIDAYISMNNIAKEITATTVEGAKTETAYYDNYNKKMFPLTAVDSEAKLTEYLKNSSVIKENYVKVSAVKQSGDVIYYLNEDETKIIGVTSGAPGNLISLSDTNLHLLGIEKVQPGEEGYTVSGATYRVGTKIFQTLAAAIDAAADASLSSTELYVNQYNSAAAASYASEDALKAACVTDTRADYDSKWIVRASYTVDSTGTPNVDITKSVNANGAVLDPTDYSKWTFNSDMTGEATVVVDETVTSIVNGALKVESKDVPTVFAYDFLPVNSTYSDAGTIGYHWTYGTEATTAAAIVPSTNRNATNEYTAVLYAETGRGRSGMGVRYDVVSDWIDFLDELAINQDNGYSETKAEFISNYKDMIYTKYLYDVYTGEIDYSAVVKTDLYNITGLLNDIYKYSTKDTYYYANTSELVYLMQQYDKYVGEYFDKAEVATSEWGELMLSVLNAVTEDDFKNDKDYKKYVNKVEELEDAYEDATSKAMITKAEKGMYDLLTSVPYTAASVSKADLNATASGLYFNAKTAPDTYTTAPSTFGNGLYNNYNYFVAAVKKAAEADTLEGQNGAYGWSWTTTYAGGYYSLYPMADYIDYDYSSVNAAYTGNKAADDFVGAPATAEYEWFWNVYQLAVKMSKTNKYQGAIDAIDAALNEAVEALSVTTTPYATETSAMEEMVEHYDGKIESDYDAGYYGMYVLANNFADVAEGKYQTRVARNIVEVAGEALTYQGTQVTVTKNDIKSLKASIADGQTALKAIKEDKNYNAAQVNALNKAIASAQDLVDLYQGTYSTSKTYQSVNKTYSKLVGDKDQMVKSDIESAIEAINAAIDYSEIIMDWNKTVDGWTYGTEDGYLNNGWNKIGSVWYYFDEDGTAKESEWFKDENGKWYWFNSNCGAAIGWAKVDGDWYYFGGDNAMKTGWQRVDGNWYYLAASGKMATGWVQVGGKWYYMSKESNSLGQMLANTTVEGYKLGADGAMIEK